MQASTPHPFPSFKRPLPEYPHYTTPSLNTPPSSNPAPAPDISMHLFESILLLFINPVIVYISMWNQKK